MRKFIICFVTALALSVSSVHAGQGGAGHSHAPATPVTENQAIKNASDAVAAIVKKGKLDASWAEVKSMEAKKKMNQYGQEWVISFINPKIAEKEKNTLYVFLSLDGQYLGANFSKN